MILKLSSEKANKVLGWRQVWDFDQTIEKTIFWYKSVFQGKPSFECCLNDIKSYEDSKINGI